MGALLSGNIWFVLRLVLIQISRKGVWVGFCITEIWNE